MTGEETALLRVSEAGGETDLRTAIGAAGTQSRGDRSQTHAPGTPQALSQETHWEPPLLDPGVTPVGNKDVILSVHSDASRCIELTVAFAIGAKADQKLSIMVKNLENKC